MPSPAAEGGRVAEILERFQHANRWRDHVMVVAHRGGWMEHGRIVAAENSIAAIERALALGAEMVEVDVRRSADGVFVVMHDSWLDRTTTCQGEVALKTLAELRACRLVVEGTGKVDRREGADACRTASRGERAGPCQPGQQTRGR